MKKPTLTILPGIPALGKDAYALKMDAVLVEVDQFGPHLIRYGHTWFSRLKIKQSLTLGRNVVLISRFITLGEIAFYQKLTARMGVELKVDVSAIELSAHSQNINGVPPATIERMTSQFKPFHAATKLEG